MKVNKLIRSCYIYDSMGRAYEFNMCFDGSYYFTLGNIRADWSFPKVEDAVAQYDLLYTDVEGKEVDWFVKWVLWG